MFGEAHLRRAVDAYASYYNEVRRRLSLDKDVPGFRCAQPLRNVMALPMLGGLDHHDVKV